MSNTAHGAPRNAPARDASTSFGRIPRPETLARGVNAATIIGSATLTLIAVLSRRAAVPVVAEYLAVLLLAVTSLVISESGMPATGVCVLVVGVELTILVSPYLAPKGSDLLIDFFLLGGIGVMGLLVVAAIFGGTWFVVCLTVPAAVDFAAVLFLQRPSLERFGIPEIAVAFAAGAFLICYLQREIVDSRTRVRMEVERALAAEESMRHMLDEKTILVRELHHRVKNNLQVVMSLLRLQADRCADRDVADDLMAIQGRVSTMAFVHDSIYEGDNLAKVHVGPFVTTLASSIQQRYGMNRSFAADIRVDDFALDIGRMVSLGLILNELISNSFRHAFPEIPPGAESGPNCRPEVSLRIERDSTGTVRILCADNGVGISADALERPREHGLGLTLARQLSRQLHADLRIVCGSAGNEELGTRWQMEFML